MEDRKQEIDKFLDAGLKHYSDAEPRDGLEGRLLATVLVESHRFETKPWARGLAVAMVLASFAALFLARNPVWDSGRPANQTLNAHKQSPVQIGISLSPTINDRPVRRHSAFHRTVRPLQEANGEEPRLEQFPSSQPLNEQEEILVRYLKQRRKEAVMVARAKAELENKKFFSSAQGIQLIGSLPTLQSQTTF